MPSATAVAQLRFKPIVTCSVIEFFNDHPNSVLLPPEIATHRPQAREYYSAVFVEGSICHFCLLVASPLLWLRAMISPHTQQQWFVIYSKPQKEEVAQVSLKQKGVEVFFPRLLLPRSSQKRKLVIPLFPNYLFVRINVETQYYSVLWAPGVKNFVSFNNSPAPLDENIAECLLERADAAGIIAARSDLAVGQEVRIRGGSFEGLIGLLQNVPDAKGRVQVLMRILNREIKVELPLHLVAGSWIPRGPVEHPRLQ